MKKIIVLAVLLAAAGGSILFAEGSQEQDQEQYYGRGPGAGPGFSDMGPSRGGRGTGQYADERWEGFNADDVISVTGTLVLVDNFHPALQTGDGVYELMYPRFFDDEIDLEEGETVTVEGFLVPGPRWEEENEEELYLHVTKAIIDGEEYILDDGQGPGPRMAGKSPRRRGGAEAGGRRW